MHELLELDVRHYQGMLGLTQEVAVRPEARMSVRGTIRLIWVLAANGLAVYFVVYGFPVVRELRSYLEATGPTNPGLHDYARGLIPALGVVLELCRSRWAKYFNIGYFGLATIIFAFVAFQSAGDAEARAHALLIVAAAAAITVIDAFLYRGNSTPVPASESRTTST